jgi:hypothetical protein
MNVMGVKELVGHFEFKAMKNHLLDLSGEGLTILRDAMWETWNKTDDVTFLKLVNHIDMEIAKRIGWWEDWDQKAPIPFQEVFEIFQPEMIGPLEFGQFRSNATVADLVVRLGLFPSVTEARKNGYNKPLTSGEYQFKNGKNGIKRVLVTEFHG